MLSCEHGGSQVELSLWPFCGRIPGPGVSLTGNSIYKNKSVCEKRRDRNIGLLFAPSHGILSLNKTIGFNSSRGLSRDTSKSRIPLKTAEQINRNSKSARCKIGKKKVVRVALKSS